MLLSVWPSPTHPVSEILDTARMADAEGWYGVWFADHYMPNSEDGSPLDGPVQEAWAVLPAIAAVTNRVRIGPLVAPTTVHHPALLANRAATIDELSQGRFVLGLGAGWQVNEHRAYGIELFEPRERVDRFDEAIQIVRSLLDEPRTSFDGTHFQVDDAPCDPKPVQARLPILVGTGSPRMLRITARHADEWNVWGTPGTVAQRLDAFHRACDQVGRDPATIRRSAQAMFFVTDDPERAARLRERAPADRSLFGSAAQLAEQVDRYIELGLDELIVPDFTLGRALSERLDGYRQIAEVVAGVVGS